MTIVERIMMPVMMLCVCLFVSLGIAQAQEQHAEVSSLPDQLPDAQVATSEAVDQPVGVTIDVLVASAYVFRGLNVFQEQSQSDANFLFAPGITWSIFDSGFSLGYWGAYQINGDNRGEMVDNALGHEQDLFAGYERSYDSIGLGWSASLVYYFYPFASEADAGATNPSFLEPVFGLSYANGVDLGFKISYFAGLQPALRDLSYLYVNPSIGKGFDLGNGFELSLGLGYGYKHFKDRSLKDNVHDVAFDVAITMNLTDTFYIAPAIHAVWTNLTRVDEIVRDENGDFVPDGLGAPTSESRELGIGDEAMVWGGINIGVNL